MSYTLNSDKVSYSINAYGGSQSNLTLVSTYKGLPITKISDSAFSGNTSITSVTVNDEITNVGQEAFYNCSGLTNVVFSQTSQLVSIGQKAFASCSGLFTR